MILDSCCVFFKGGWEPLKHMVPNKFNPPKKTWQDRPLVDFPHVSPTFRTITPGNQACWKSLHLVWLISYLDSFECHVLPVFFHLKMDIPWFSQIAMFDYRTSPWQARQEHCPDDHRRSRRETASAVVVVSWGKDSWLVLWNFFCFPIYIYIYWE